MERLLAWHGLASTSLGEVTQECGALAVQTLGQLLSEALPPLRYSFPLPDSWAGLYFLPLSIHELAHIQGPGRLQLVYELRRPWLKLLPRARPRSQHKLGQPTPLADQAVPTRTFFLAVVSPQNP